MAGNRVPGYLAQVGADDDSDVFEVDDGTMVRAPSATPGVVKGPPEISDLRNARRPNRRPRADTNPIGRIPPHRAPTAAELLATPIVRQALDQAWRDTQADDSAHGNPHAREQGGWIYIDIRSGELSIRRSTRYPRNPFSISLDPPDIVQGATIVGSFHTHPSDPFAPANEIDITLQGQYGVPGFIRGRGGRTQTYGPDHRAGGPWEISRLEPGWAP
jgi:hypothetical protein